MRNHFARFPRRKPIPCPALHILPERQIALIATALFVVSDRPQACMRHEADARSALTLHLPCLVAAGGDLRGPLLRERAHGARGELRDSREQQARACPLS